MPLKLGSTTVQLRLGSQAVTGRLGSALVTATVPDAPDLVSATFDGDFTYIEFSFYIPPKSNGGSPILNYEVDIQGYGILAPDDVSYGDGGQYQVWQYYSSLVDASVHVRAINAVGAGPWSNSLEVAAL